MKKRILKKRIKKSEPKELPLKRKRRRGKAGLRQGNKKTTAIAKLRHKKLIKTILENVGKDGIGKVMEKAGYSKNYANSGNIKNTQSWNDLMEKYLPDEKVAEVHRKLLTKTHIGSQTFPFKITNKDINKTIEEFGFKVVRILEVKNKIDSKKIAFFPIMDVQAARSALDMSYKLKNKYGETVVRHKFGELTDAELEEELAGTISEGVRLNEGEEA